MDASGQIWTVGALLTDMVARNGSGRTRAIHKGDELRVRSIQVVT